MNTSTTKQSQTSLTRRGFALWVLLCVLWLSAASPFLHNCSAGASSGDGTSISSGFGCPSCDWLALSGSAHVDAPEQTEQPRVVDAQFAPDIQARPLQSSSFISSRGPPA